MKDFRGLRVVVAAISLCALLALYAGMELRPAVAEGGDEANVCRVLADKTIAAVQAACASLPAGSLCSLNADGSKNITPLDTLTTFTGTAAEPTSGAWTVALLNIQAGESTVAAAYFGGGSLTAPARPDANAPLLKVKTFDDLPVLLRAGASANFPQVTRLLYGQEALADGRNAKGTWVRVRHEGLVGWANLDMIRIDGDPAALPEMAETDLAPLFSYPSPMQAFTFSAAEKSACAEAGSGLLLQFTGEKAAHLLIDGADVAATKATLLVRAVAKANLEIMAVQGEALITALGAERALKQGEMARLRLGGPDGLTVIGGARPAEPFAFAAIEGAPFGALAQPLPCVAGVLPTDARTAARSGPGEKEYTSLFFMQPAAMYGVEGWNTDADNNKWWKLVGGPSAENWVAAAAVRTLGACDALKKVEPGDYGAAGESGGVPGGGGFAPSTKTVWNAEISGDQMSGTCGGAAINYCAHLVALTPSGSGLMWKGQELKTYRLARASENVYAYNGPNGLGDGKIKMVLVFSSPTTFTMTQTVTYDREPGCQHTHVLAGTIR